MIHPLLQSRFGGVFLYKQFKIRMIFSVVIAILAAYFMYQYLGSLKKEVVIVVPVKDIESKTKITKEMLTTLTIDEQDQKAMYPHAVINLEEIIGAITKVKLEKNKPIEKKADLLVFGEESTQALNYQGGVDNAYFIPYEKRVISIEVDAQGALNFGLKRGDFVDLIYTSKGEDQNKYANMILQHIEIFDIESITNSKDLPISAGKKQVIQLIATPDQCLKITAAKRNGSIDLVLNPLQGETGPRDPITLDSFAPPRPMPKSDMLQGIEDHIQQQDITESVKKELIESIQKEKQLDVIKRAIEATALSKEKKDELLKQVK